MILFSCFCTRLCKPASHEHIHKHCERVFELLRTPLLNRGTQHRPEFESDKQLDINDKTG